MVLNLDLNDPPEEDMVPEIEDVDVSLTLAFPWDSQSAQMQINGPDSDDDDVVICSPRAFAEAREKARRNRMVIEVTDEESEMQRSYSGLTSRSFPCANWGRRIPVKRTIVNCLQCIDLESNSRVKNWTCPLHPKGVSERTSSPQSIALPRLPRFHCPICIGPFVEETSTKCGHIFCKACIHAAIEAQNKCPACRLKLKLKDTFRIYLPASD